MSFFHSFQLVPKLFPNKNPARDGRICRIFLGINPSRIRGANSTGKATRAGLVEIKGHTPQDNDEPFFCSLHGQSSCPRKAGCQMATNRRSFVAEPMNCGACPPRHDGLPHRSRWSHLAIMESTGKVGLGSSDRKEITGAGTWTV